MSKFFFEVNSDNIKYILSNAHPPELFEVDSILENADTRELTKYEIALLIAAMNSPIFEEIKKKVISKSRTIRHRIHGNKVIPMAPVEVTNRCSSNCNFCGWRSDNKDMNRMTVSESLMMTQISYLLSKGIGHIELVGGDDIGFVKNTLPKLIPEVKKKQENMEGGKLSFCTMALTENQYKKLKAIGADTMIMWQETYDKNVFKQHITAGPKAWGIDDDFKVIKGGDGYKFRLESQDRAAEAGLGLSVGAILGLNPDYGFEILATIDHANHLIEKWEPSEPIIVGMPTWNKITTPRTDNRPEQTLPIENFFTYFSCLYFLALNKHKTWVFPNCRVSIDIQVEAVDASGVFTSTEVKLGPGGYVNSALKHLTHTQQDKVKTELIALFKDDVDNSDIQKYLDDMEQFQHHYHVHEDYIAAFDKVNLVCETEKNILISSE